MKKQIIAKLTKTFEEYAYEKDGVEFWFARDLQKVLGYADLRNFLKVVDKAKESAQQAKQEVSDHFVGVNRMVQLGSGSEREVEDIILTRYACYLIAQNGDPRKEEIAFAQSYFAVQTRKQELIEDRIALTERLTAREKLTASETELSKLIYEQGVDNTGFARIRSKGDKTLFGGKTTIEMKNKLNVPKGRPLADFLPTVTITAKNLATEITNHTVKTEELSGEDNITTEHVKNNTKVRKLLVESNIIPEKLPAEEDLKKLERRIRKGEKKLAKRAISTTSKEE